MPWPTNRKSYTIYDLLYGTIFNDPNDGNELYPR